MSISSRTPEGEPNECPICGHDFALEPSLDTLDGCCPSCGVLVWFAAPPPKRDDPLSVRNRIFALALAKFGWPITSDSSFVGFMPRGNAGARWLRALEKAHDWAEFVLLLQTEK